MSKGIFLLSFISLSLALLVPFACAENISRASAKSPTVDDYEGTWIMKSPEDVKSLRWDGKNPNTQKFTIVIKKESDRTVTGAVIYSGELEVHDGKSKLTKATENFIGILDSDGVLRCVETGDTGMLTMKLIGNNIFDYTYLEPGKYAFVARGIFHKEK